MKEINGINFHFGIGFLNDLLNGTGWNLNDLGTVPDLVTIPKMMYYSHLYSLKRKGLSTDIDPFFIDDAIDNNGGVNGELWLAFSVAFNESMTKNVPQTDDKKKVM